MAREIARSIGPSGAIMSETGRLDGERVVCMDLWILGLNANCLPFIEYGAWHIPSLEFVLLCPIFQGSPQRRRPVMISVSGKADSSISLD